MFIFASKVALGAFNGLSNNCCLLGILKKGDANTYLNFLSSAKVLFFRVYDFT